MQGKKFKDEIRIAISSYTFFKKRVLAYNQTEAGAVTYSSLLGAAQEHFPQYLDEVRGMADGAGLDFSLVSLKIRVGNSSEEVGSVISHSITGIFWCSEWKGRLYKMCNVGISPHTPYTRVLLPYSRGLMQQLKQALLMR